MYIDIISVRAILQYEERKWKWLREKEYQELLNKENYWIGRISREIISLWYFGFWLDLIYFTPTYN